MVMNILQKVTRAVVLSQSSDRQKVEYLLRLIAVSDNPKLLGHVANQIAGELLDATREETRQEEIQKNDAQKIQSILQSLQKHSEGS